MIKVNNFSQYCPYQGKLSTRTVQIALEFECFFIFGRGLLYSNG